MYAQKALFLSNVWFSHNFIHEANGFISAVYTELEIIEFSNNRNEKHWSANPQRS